MFIVSVLIFYFDCKVLPYTYSKSGSLSMFTFLARQKINFPSLSLSLSLSPFLLLLLFPPRSVSSCWRCARQTGLLVKMAGDADGPNNSTMLASAIRTAARTAAPRVLSSGKDPFNQCPCFIYFYLELGDQGRQRMVHPFRHLAVFRCRLPRILGSCLVPTSLMQIQCCHH